MISKDIASPIMKSIRESIEKYEYQKAKEINRELVELLIKKDN